MNYDRDEVEWVAQGNLRTKDTIGPVWNFYRVKGDEYTLRAPMNRAIFRQIGRKVYLGDELIAEGDSAWKATYAAMAYFYTTLTPFLARETRNDYAA